MSNTERLNATQLPEEEYDDFPEFLDDTPDDTPDESEVPEPAESSRFKDGHFVQYPTGKPKHYSKDRRYVPSVKKSDAKKMNVRSSGGKGSKHRKSQDTL